MPVETSMGVSQDVQEKLKRAGDATAKADPNAVAGTHTLAERTYLTHAGEAVPSGHPDAAFLLGVPGAPIPSDLAEKLGLTGDAADKKADANKADPKKPDDKPADPPTVKP